MGGHWFSVMLLKRHSVLAPCLALGKGKANDVSLSPAEIYSWTIWSSEHLTEPGCLSPTLPSGRHPSSFGVSLPPLGEVLGGLVQMPQWTGPSSPSQCSQGWSCSLSTDTVVSEDCLELKTQDLGLSASEPCRDCRARRDSTFPAQSTTRLPPQLLTS